MQTVNIAEKLSQFEGTWNPKILGEVNDSYVKAVKLKGEFVWHHHENEDELFLVVRGRLRVDFRDCSVELAPGELLIVPHGVEHRTVADEEVEVLLFEPAGVRNTGNVEDPILTAPQAARL